MVIQLEVAFLDHSIELRVKAKVLTMTYKGPLWSVPPDVWLHLSLVFLYSFVSTPLASLNYLRSFASAVPSAQHALPVLCGASFRSLLKNDLLNGAFHDHPIQNFNSLPNISLLVLIFSSKHYCSQTHGICLCPLGSNFPLPCTFHRGRDFCLFFSLLYS